MGRDLGSVTTAVSGDWTYTAGTVDAGTSTVVFNHPSASQTVTAGAMSFNNVTIDSGDTITGTVSAINLALDGLTFDPAGIGAASLGLTTDDQGNTGSGGAQSDTDTISITVSPSNSAPTINDQSLIIEENSPIGTLVAVLAASDPDSGDVLTYSIIADSSGAGFAIEGSSGALTVNDSTALNTEFLSSIVLTVLVADNGTPALSDTATVVINLTPAPVIPDPDIPDTKDPAPDPTTPDPEEEEEPEEDEDEDEEETPPDVGIPPEGDGDQDPDTPILDEPEPPDFVPCAGRCSITW